MKTLVAPIALVAVLCVAGLGLFGASSHAAGGFGSAAYCADKAHARTCHDMDSNSTLYSNTRMWISAERDRDLKECELEAERAGDSMLTSVRGCFASHGWEYLGAPGMMQNYGRAVRPKIAH